jgi:hypothetical protein
MKDFYYILGLGQESTLDEIKEAYRKLSKKLHPDLNQGDQYFEDRFKDIKEAFETLRDPIKRARYNEQLNRYKTDADIKRQQSYEKAYRQNAARQSARTYRAASAQSMRRNRSLGVDITMIAVAVVLAVYLYNMFSKSPKPKSVYTDATAPVASVTHARHKHWHGVKNRAAADSARHGLNAEQIAVNKQRTEVFMPPKPATGKTEVAEVPIVIKPVQKPDTVKPAGRNDFLYSTFVHPNVTGVVRMRAYNSFNSNIIASIPARSRVLVLERGSTYYRVFYDNSIGFVPKWSLEEK